MCTNVTDKWEIWHTCIDVAERGREICQWTKLFNSSWEEISSRCSLVSVSSY